MKLLISIILIFSTCLTCSWGPITHGSIAQRVAAQVSIPNTSAYYAGCVLPDIALARNLGQDDYRQGLFHSPAFLANLKSLAVTPELKSLVMGWTVHLISDEVEGRYGSQIHVCPTCGQAINAPFKLEWGVDAIVGTSISRITISTNVASAVAKAWALTYPTDKSVTTSWVKSSGFFYSLYFTGRYTPASKSEALKYFPDYQKYLDESVTLSVAALAPAIK